LKKTLRVVSDTEAAFDEESPGASVGAGVIVVADTANGDSALRWALVLVRNLVALGSQVSVAVYSGATEAAHREAVQGRFLSEGATEVQLGARLGPLAASLRAGSAAQVSLLVGGLALRHVEGGVRIVLRAPQVGRPGSSAVEDLEGGADVVLGSTREAFAEQYARRILGID